RGCADGSERTRTPRVEAVKRIITGAVGGTVLCATVLWLGVVSAAEAQTRRPAPADFAELTELEDVQLSPDGKWVAAVIREPAGAAAQGARGGRGVFLVPADGAARPRRIAPDLGDAHFPRWSPDGRTLAFIAAGGAGGGR